VLRRAHHRRGNQIWGGALISARRFGETGKAIGLDMTDEMLARERRRRGRDQRRVRQGPHRGDPPPDASVDVAISNCVINLSGDKQQVLNETARVLRPGGRLAVSDVIADPNMDELTRADMAQWTGCIAGALTEDEFRAALTSAGLVDIEIRRTHRVHEHAGSAIVRARKPQ
jgi:arsenite methyltransferase